MYLDQKDILFFFSFFMVITYDAFVESTRILYGFLNG